MFPHLIPPSGDRLNTEQQITNEVRQLQVQLSATEADRDQLLEKVDMLEATVAKVLWKSTRNASR